MPSALITGTSTGIGLETALLFARRGYRVYAAARNPGASEGLQKGLANGLSLTSVALDVNSDEFCAPTSPVLASRVPDVECRVAAEAASEGFHNSRDGRCFPSYEAIADKAKCCRDTVYEAIKALEACHG